MSLLRTAFCCLFSVVCAGIPTELNATTYSTVGSGNWGSASIWANGQVPPLTGGDSICIRHGVFYSSSIVLTMATYLQLDSSGTLCGHRKFFVPSGSALMNYGEVYADSLIINGGTVTNYGFMHMTNMAVVNFGGSLMNYGNMLVGHSFLCFEKSNGFEEVENGSYHSLIYPLPIRNGEAFRVKGLEEDCTVRIYTLAGQLVYEGKTGNGEGILITGLSAGIYSIEASRPEQVLYRGN